MRLETPRLILDLHTAADLEPMLEMWSDPGTVTFVGGKPSNRQDTWMRLLRYRGLWDVLGYGYWVVRDRATGRFAGELGFADFHRATTPAFEGTPEAGWVLAPWARGRGLAREALTAALAWLDAAGHPHSVCIIDPANTASLRLAAGLGYAEPTEIRHGEDPVTLYTRRRARPA